MNSCRISEDVGWTNFLERRKGEVRRIPIPRTPVDKGKKDWKRRGIVALTPASSKRRQALASASSKSPKARARCYSLPILKPLTLQKAPPPNRCSSGTTARGGWVLLVVS